MITPQPLKKGDKIAIVSLSSGMLGETFCAHEVRLGTMRMREFGLEPVFMENSLKGMNYIRNHPEKRAADLKAAFLDSSISGIICAIGGDDTYRTIPYLMEDEEFISAVKNDPKFFLGFSDTTVNHLMFHKLGLRTFYGQAFICDLAELADDMLPYTKNAFGECFAPHSDRKIVSSDVWYTDRTDYSEASVGIDYKSHKETRGFELLQGRPVFSGELLGGCVESMYEMLTDDRYADMPEIVQKYGVFPEPDEWKGKILFAETSEEKPEPEKLRKIIEKFKEYGIFSRINGVIVGKPKDEQYYSEYKKVWSDVLSDTDIPVLYNVNFGHALPRTILPYGAEACVDAENKVITIK